MVVVGWVAGAVVVANVVVGWVAGAVVVANVVVGSVVDAVVVAIVDVKTGSSHSSPSQLASQEQMKVKLPFMQLPLAHGSEAHLLSVFSATPKDFFTLPANSSNSTEFIFSKTSSSTLNAQG